jgi:aryl-alcohol dehydrogenase-like predicted oxidoreductase
MRISAEHPLYLTHALRRPEIALAAIEKLRGATGRAEIEGLVELLVEPPNARAATAAIDALAAAGAPIVIIALLAALDSPHTTVRIAALESLHQRKEFTNLDALERRLREDESWLVRRAALRALADGPERWRVLAAADDPHWRVRHALIKALLGWAEMSEARREIDARLAALPPRPRVRGLRAYLHDCWGDALAASAEPDEGPDPLHEHPLWDWDVAVLARNLECLTDEERRRDLDVMPKLLAHPDDRIRTQAADTLLRWGEPRHLAAAFALLDEPRYGAGVILTGLLERLDLDRLDEAARFIVESPNPTPKQHSWARQQLDNADKLPQLGKTIERLDPYVRAAALTVERATELMREPTLETSWHVLAKAARLTKTPLWNIEPDPPWRPDERRRVTLAPLNLSHPSPPNARRLGPERWLVSPVGVSGHYGLPVDGFAHAYQAGVNLMFWEPNYQTMTDFFGRLSTADRSSIHVIAGTFEADGPRVRRDAERVLRVLKIERVSLFLMFWVQSWKRIPPDVRAALEQLRTSGKVERYSLSTHNRALAVEAMEAGWDPVMVRHSAAHRGAEQRIFPRAAELGTSLITFNNTCYARLLKRDDAPHASDFYRYTLSHPAVTVCLTAPSTLEQLEENLSAMYDPTLPEERRRCLLAHGDGVYREDTVFRKLVRSR